MSTPKIAIVYHSGFGHTAVAAEEVAAGARDAGAVVELLRIQGPGDDFAPLLEKASAADAIVFGSPTYMGDVSAALKAFFEASSKVWATRGWQDKLAAGFTNSLSMGGDKSNTLGSIFTLAMQHGMIWVGTGLPPGNANGNSTSAPEAVNRLSYSTGLATQSDNASPEVTPPAGDRETARLFGARIVETARKLIR
ncbi:MAG: NADPH-dependent FMN reductase [Alphaproteobacteria bacterium]|nr:NADPH-dependent FMN reductase [Alphaproteobacteria bacterium]